MRVAPIKKKSVGNIERDVTSSQNTMSSPVCTRVCPSGQCSVFLFSHTVFDCVGKIEGVTGS